MVYSLFQKENRVGWLEEERLSILKMRRRMMKTKRIYLETVMMEV
jgi:hypothetical protein